MFPNHLTHADLHNYITDTTHHPSTCPICGTALNQEQQP
jgi:hypothetical protein